MGRSGVSKYLPDLLGTGPWSFSMVQLCLAALMALRLLFRAILAELARSWSDGFWWASAWGRLMVLDISFDPAFH